jgi:hypothetical protein
LENWKLINISDEAPTLEDLRALGTAKQSLLLLRRLATLNYNPASRFNKGSFYRTPLGDDLTGGYKPEDARAVKDLLLGAPWHRLESDGFISGDGMGWFCIMPEGFEAVKHAEVVLVDREIMAALVLLHPEFQSYAHYFREGKLVEAVAAAFEKYENRLNKVRDSSNNPAVRVAVGVPLVYKLFEDKVLVRPYPNLGGSDTKKEAYEKGLTGILSGGIGWIRNAYSHEKHNLPEPTAQEALQLLFVASYMMHMLDIAKP